MIVGKVLSQDIKLADCSIFDKLRGALALSRSPRDPYPTLVKRFWPEFMFRVTCHGLGKNTGQRFVSSVILLIRYL